MAARGRGLRRQDRFGKEGRGDQRTAFQRDRDRILYSSALRRLAGVTQVVGVAHGHVFHNRLTHSLKVAQVGRRLSEKLLREAAGRWPSKPAALDPEVVEAACFAHDLGHPPFGHTGEVALDSCLKAAGCPEGYEGNAQSFRIITRLATRRQDESGLNLTRATLNAVLKYPWLHKPKGKQSRKFGAYRSEKKLFSFARKLTTGSEQSVEASVMDWSDDITYSVHDLEDFYRAGFVPLDRLALDRAECVRAVGSGDADILHNLLQEFLPDSLRQPYEGTRAQRGALRWFTSFLVGRYVKATAWKAGRAPRAVRVPSDYRAENGVLKRLMVSYVFRAQALVNQQYGHKRVVKELFDIYLDAVTKPEENGVLPQQYRDHGCRAKAECARQAADIIAAMTEEQAMAIHGRLAGRAPGHVLDRIFV